jgi:hypothetical protein
MLNSFEWGINITSVIITSVVVFNIECCGNALRSIIYSLEEENVRNKIKFNTPSSPVEVLTN